jgi:FtsZ-binding cell division protein ZapB
MIFLNYSGLMDADIKELEDKISRLIALCSSLREENTQLREKSATMKNNMDQASKKLEGLLGQLPNGEEVA